MPEIVGAYARFSNDGLQRDSSIDDQFTTCTQAAEEKGWAYDPSLQFSDAGLSGALMSTRDSLQVLLKLIESDKTKSFAICKPSSRRSIRALRNATTMP